MDGLIRRGLWLPVSVTFMPKEDSDVRTPTTEYLSVSQYSHSLTLPLGLLSYVFGPAESICQCFEVREKQVRSCSLRKDLREVSEPR